MKKIFFVLLSILFINDSLNARNFLDRFVNSNRALAQSYEKACFNGDIYKCDKVGWLYQRGDGVEKNLSKAKKFYTIACDANYGSSCSNLGLIYRQDEQDYIKAAEYYSKACISGGHDLGCAVLGNLYNEGKGVEQDYLKAKKFYTIACNGTVARGCYYIGILYESGHGVEKNLSKAKEFYKKGCNGAVSLSCKKYSEIEKY